MEFEGEYFRDLKNGKGKEYDKNGILIFEGFYVNNEKMTKTFIFHENNNDNDDNNDDEDDNDEDNSVDDGADNDEN